MSHPHFKLSMLTLSLSMLLTACGGGGGGSSSSTVTPATNTSGTVVDGYFAGSTVTLDQNDNGTCESTEPTTTTDANGHYDFSNVAGASGQHQVCVTGGVDQITHQPLLGQFFGPSGASVVTPFTTLIVSQAKATGQSVNAVAATLATNLGLGSTNLLSTDPVAAAASNPALLQTTAAIQALIVQTTNILQAASGGNSASTSTTSALFNSVLASVASQVASLTTPLTTASLSNPSFITSVVTAATQNAQSNPALTNNLPALSSLAPASVAAFVQPALSAITNTVATSNTATLLSQSNSNPAAGAQSNSVTSNTVAAVASTLLTTQAASQGVTSSQLTTIANAAITVPTGGLPAAAPAQTTITAINQNTPTSVSSNLPASTASSLSSANIASNSAQVTGVAINCAPNCSSGASSLVNNASYLAMLASTGALNDITLTLGGIKGNAVQPLLATPSGLPAATASTLPTPNTNFPVTAGTEYQGSLRINVIPAAGGAQNLSFTINNVVLYQSVANGSAVITGFIPDSATLTASGTTTAGVTGNATLNAAALNSLVSFNAANSSISLNIASLLSQLGQSSTVLKQAAGLDGSVKGQFLINSSFSMLQVSQNGSPTNNFSVLINFN